MRKLSFMNYYCHLYMTGRADIYKGKGGAYELYR